MSESHLRRPEHGTLVRNASRRRAERLGGVRGGDTFAAVIFEVWALRPVWRAEASFMTMTGACILGTEGRGCRERDSFSAFVDLFLFSTPETSLYCEKVGLYLDPSRALEATINICIQLRLLVNSFPIAIHDIVISLCLLS